MPHPRKKHKKAFTLIEMAIVLVIMGLIAALIFPAITDFIKFGKKTEAKDFLGQVKDKIIGFALMNKRLPTSLNEIGVGQDPYGNDIFYNPDSDLTSGDLCGKTSTDLDVDKVDQGGGTTSYDDIAFVVASSGRNNHQEFVGAETSGTVTIYDPRYWHNAPGYGTGEYDDYDDIVEYVSLAYLRNKVCTNVANQSFNPPGSDVSFAQNIGDFTGADTGIAPPGSSTGAVTINVEEGTVELGGGADNPSESGCVWYQGDNAAGNCSNGKCELNYGIRAFFNFKFDPPDTSADSTDKGGGFTFAVIDGDANNASCCGAASFHNGYSGSGIYGSLSPQKMAAEIDVYPSGGGGAGSVRNDPVNNHVAFVYWGNNRNDDNDHDEYYTYTDPTTGGDVHMNPAYYASPSPALDGPAIHPGSTPTWMEKGNEHSVRIEVYRDSTDPGNGYSGIFNSTVWIDCTNCTDLTLPWNTTYGTYDAIIHHNCTVGSNATAQFPHMFFGWTEATGSGTRQINVIISDFGVKFLNDTPNHQY